MGWISTSKNQNNSGFGTRKLHVGRSLSFPIYKMGRGLTQRVRIFRALECSVVVDAACQLPGIRKQSTSILVVPQSQDVHILTPLRLTSEATQQNQQDRGRPGKRLFLELHKILRGCSPSSGSGPTVVFCLLPGPCLSPRHPCFPYPSQQEHALLFLSSSS